MLIRFKANGDFVYVNPYRAFVIRKWDDKNTIIWSEDEKNSVIVNEPLDAVAVRLENARQ